MRRSGRAMKDKKRNGPAPEQVIREYESGVRFKAGLGTRGLYEQNRINERFYTGDQWAGARCGEDRPLVRYNLIKRIGEYKMAVIGSNPLAVQYTADGVTLTPEIQKAVGDRRKELSRRGALPPSPLEGFWSGRPDDEEIQLVLSALSDYYRTTEERVGLGVLRQEMLRNAYCTGTGVLYTWWDDTVRTGLYADISRTAPVKGDITCEALDIDNVYFGDPNEVDVQKQPYILVAQRRSVRALRQEALRAGMPPELAEGIVSDRENPRAGTQEPDASDKATVLTRLWKEYASDGSVVTVRAERVCANGAMVRPEWDVGIRMYPLAVFVWERRKGCAYGDSEVTHLIPNQIAVNRILTASVWAAMATGMPIMMVDGDMVTGRITNDPGQIIKIFGAEGDMGQAIRYIEPPAFSSAFDGLVSSLVENTLTQAGANAVALGDIRPDNTSAIIAAREASTLPLQLVQNRYLRTCEEVARIWAEFWVMKYGDRLLRVEDGDGVWYLPFRGERYRDLPLRVRVQAGASTLWSESQSVQTLDNLYDRGIIDKKQYLSRLPKTSVPDLTGLLQEIPPAGRETEETHPDALSLGDNIKEESR